MSLDYHLILKKVVEYYFLNSEFKSFGKLEWCLPTEKEIKKTFEKRGIKILRQRIKYFKTEEFQNQPKTNSSDYRQLLISEIEDDGVFYCIYDYRTIGRMGQKTRYKFRIEDFQQSMNLSDLNIKLLDKRMIMIR
jgi:hypothetical protein